MIQDRKRFRLLEFFLLLTSVFLFFCFIGYYDHVSPSLAFGSRLVYLIQLPLLAGILLTLLSRMPREKLLNTVRSFLSGPEYRIFLLLSLLFWIPRLLWWHFYPSSIKSDYLVYVEQAQEYAASGSFIMSDYLVKIAPNITVYCAVLGLFMRVFGAGAVTAQWVCMALNFCNVLLLFAVAKKLTSRSRAFLASALFILLPENVFYSVLPGIEAFSLFTILLGLLLVFSIPGRKPAVQGVLAFCGGLILALSGCIRASAWAAAAAAVVWLLLSCRLPFRRMLIIFAALAVGLAGSWLWHRSFQNRIFPDEKPVSGIGWPLYEGLDITGGGWTAEKGARRDEVIANNNPADSNRIFQEDGLSRFQQYTFSEKMHMFARKGGIVWFDPGYSVYLLENQAAMNKAGQAVYCSMFFCLALWIAGMISRIIRPVTGADRASCALCLLFILLTSLWHEFGTSISRYRYMMLPFVMLMIAVCLPARTLPLRLPGCLGGLFRKARPEKTR